MNEWQQCDSRTTACAGQTNGRSGPAVVTRPTETFDKALGILATPRAKDVGRDETVMLLWSLGVKRMITGSDVLRCLLSGIGEHEKVAAMDAPSS
jgi:hypothetical protein